MSVLSMGFYERKMTSCLSSSTWIMYTRILVCLSFLCFCRHQNEDNCKILTFDFMGLSSIQVAITNVKLPFWQVYHNDGIKVKDPNDILKKMS